MTPAQLFNLNAVEVALHTPKQAQPDMGTTDDLLAFAQMAAR